MQLRYLLELHFQYKKKMNTSEEKLKNTKSLQIRFVIVSAISQDILISLDISNVDTVWTWGSKVPSPPPLSKYLSEIFPRRQIKLTNNNSYKNF